jgi:hypothetical protein
MKCRMTNSECRIASPDKVGRFYSFVIIPSSFVIFFLSGCMTAPKSVPPPPSIPPQAAPSAAPENKPPALPSKPRPAPTSVAHPPASTLAPPKDEFVMAIDSEPSGAIIVVNGIPIGKAPLHLRVKNTLQGFFRDYMTVKARFLATSSEETSITVEDDCTPREKIPGKITFTPQGVQRWQQSPVDNGK